MARQGSHQMALKHSYLCLFNIISLEFTLLEQNSFCVFGRNQNRIVRNQIPTEQTTSPDHNWQLNEMPTCTLVKDVNCDMYNFELNKQGSRGIFSLQIILFSLFLSLTTRSQSKEKEKTRIKKNKKKTMRLVDFHIHLVIYFFTLFLSNQSCLFLLLDLK